MKRNLTTLAIACVIGLGASACSDSVADFGNPADVEQAAAAKPGDKSGKVFERYGYIPAPPSGAPGGMEDGTAASPESDSTSAVFEGKKK